MELPHYSGTMLLIDTKCFQVKSPSLEIGYFVGQWDSETPKHYRILPLVLSTL